MNEKKKKKPTPPPPKQPLKAFSRVNNCREAAVNIESPNPELIAEFKSSGALSRPLCKFISTVHV
jgi:hypothetical protein